MDASLYSYRVKDADRVNVVLVGPPKQGPKGCFQALLAPTMSDLADL